MKVLLVYTNTYRMLSPAPIGIAYLARSLGEAGHLVEVADMLFAKNPRRLLDDAIERFRPDVVGFSIRNLDNQDMRETHHPLPDIREHVQSVKKRGIPTVLGGSAFSTFPAKMLEYMGADLGISGQGERAFLLLLEAIRTGAGFADIPGAVYSVEGSVRVNAPDLTGYHHIEPDWRAISFKPYRKGLFFLNTVVKSGCPFECTYCNVGCTTGLVPIQRDAAEIVEEMKAAIRTTNIRAFFLADPCFPYPMDAAKELLRAIIKARLKAQLVANVLPVKGCVDEELFGLMIKAGFQFCILGNESLSPSMLKAYRKPFDMEDVNKWAILAKKSRLRFALNLMFGGPGETRETVEETIEGLPAIPFTMLAYGAGIRILPQTALAETALKEQLIKSEEELLFPKFYFSRQVELGFVQERMKAESKRYKRRMIGMLPVGINNLFKRHGWF